MTYTYEFTTWSTYLNSCSDVSNIHVKYIILGVQHTCNDKRINAKPKQYGNCVSKEIS